MSKFRLLPDRSDKPETPARQRFDIPLKLCAIPNRVPGDIDAGRQRRIGNDSAAPNGDDEIVLADNTVTIVDQEIEQIERLRCDGNKSGAVAQFSAGRVQHIVPEEVTHAAILGQEAMVHDGTLTR
jgi:hypothetical protein